MNQFQVEQTKRRVQRLSEADIVRELSSRRTERIDGKPIQHTAAMFIVAIHSNTLKWQQHRRRSTVLCCRCVNIVRPIYITFSKFVARL